MCLKQTMFLMCVVLQLFCVTVYVTCNVTSYEKLSTYYYYYYYYYYCGCDDSLNKSLTCARNVCISSGRISCEQQNETDVTRTVSDLFVMLCLRKPYLLRGFLRYCAAVVGSKWLRRHIYQF
jgi:hypothetical protein